MKTRVGSRAPLHFVSRADDVTYKWEGNCPAVVSLESHSFRVFTLICAIFRDKGTAL